jgi:hypothetical protein
LILSKDSSPVNAAYPFVEDLVGNTICADLIDYLWRDYYFTGLPGRLGTRFFTYFFITDSGHPDATAAHMALRIEKKGHLRSDVISEVFKYLRYRYELSERALHHHAKVAADAMMAEAVRLWIEATDKETVDKLLSDRSDDGVLEYLADAHIEGASALATAVRDRQLYKEHRRASGEVTRLKKRTLYEEWQRADVRERVRRRLQEGLELEHPWLVLLSIPNPAMRLKAADVLVSWHGAIITLREWDEEHGRRAAELAASHENLWSVQLFVHPTLGSEVRDRAAAYVSAELGIDWDDRPRRAAADPVVDLAIVEIARTRMISDSEREALRAAVYRTDPQGAAPESFVQLKARLEASLETPQRGRPRPSVKNQETLLDD